MYADLLIDRMLSIRGAFMQGCNYGVTFDPPALQCGMYLAPHVGNLSAMRLCVSGVPAVHANGEVMHVLSETRERIE